jgi:hypothetical protein
MIKRGKKTKAWENDRRELKKEFERRGITTCEIRFSVCWNNNALSFAHIDKRRYLTRDELRQAVVLACISCHEVVERWPREKMRAYLEGIIENRK